jgi:hypothetical protein
MCKGSCASCEYFDGEGFCDYWQEPTEFDSWCEFYIEYDNCEIDTEE